MMMYNTNKFYEVCKLMPPFERILLSVPNNIAISATEIRIRVGRPIVIESSIERYICGTRCIDTDEIYCCIKNFCDYSIHSCQRELSEGWITLKGGHRAGFSGTARISGGKLDLICDISSLNIRIAREHKGISDVLFSKIKRFEHFNGMVIAGAPLSGKTTFLRDLCRNYGNCNKTALVDERGEIAAVYKGVPQNDIGLNTDVLDCYDKKDGIIQAMRALSPEIIICDEIGDEINSISNLGNCGIKFVFSVHCGSLYEAGKNFIISSLIESKIINVITFLDSKKNIGKMKGLWFLNNGEGVDSCNDGNNLLYNRYCNIGKS